MFHSKNIYLQKNKCSALSLFKTNNMKKQLQLLFLLVLFYSATAFSQSDITHNIISGRVQDSKGKALAGTTVELLRAKDSLLIKAGITNNDGYFEINTKANLPFILSYDLIGFEKKYSPVFTLTENKDFKAATVSLVLSPKKLEDVTVTSVHKPLIEVKADKLVFNVENSINSTGSDALELLQKSPGVQVDNNDNISMKGKSGVKIYVDGKKLELDTKDIASYLRSINSNDIEAIEMISNPSAKYDASGNAGIINIRLKKNKKIGTNGTLNLGFKQGITPKGNGSVALNYRNKKINIFGNLGGDLGRHENNLYLNKTQNDTVYDQNSKHDHQSENYNAKVGLDYFMDNKNTFGFLVKYNNQNDHWSSNGNTNIYYQTQSSANFIKRLLASDSIPGLRTNMNANLNYRYADTLGTEITADADYGTFRGRGNSYQPNYYLDAKGNTISTSIYANHTPTDINIYTAKVDAEMNRWGGKLGYGAKISYVNTDNTFDFYAVSPKTFVQTKLLSQSNQFDYTENVNAGYINYQHKLNSKWDLQLGLRLEQTNSQGKLVRDDGLKKSDDTVKNNYLDIFPSGALTWTINGKNSLTLTYSRRIDRPSYQDLNPFEFKLDELTYMKGNPFLKPQYTDNLELTHTFMGFLNTTIGYSNVKNYATQVTDTVRNASYVQQQNLATQQIFNFNIGSSLPIKKWWNGYANIYYNYQLFDGHINDKPIHTEIPDYGAYLQSTFTLGHNFSTEISGWYSGPSLWAATWFTKPQGGIDVGVQKQLFDKKATLKLTVTDPFYTEPWKANSDFGGLKIKAGGNWESRTFRIAFSYRFGSSQIKDARDRKTGLETESKRIKSGN